MKPKLCVTMDGEMGYPRIVDVSINGKSLPATRVMMSQQADQMPTLVLEISMKHVNIIFESPTEE